MKPKYLIFIAPPLLFLEIYCFSRIVELLRKQSDTTVIIGLILTSVFVFGNYILINYLIKQFKQNKMK